MIGMLNQFYQTFWKDYVLEEFPTKYSFYVRNQDAFVSDYAATNPAEDIAETFRVFVMEEKPTGNKIRDKKVRFLLLPDEPCPPFDFLNPLPLPYRTETDRRYPAAAPRRSSGCCPNPLVHEGHPKGAQ